MIWIIVLSASALYSIFIMCLLVIGSRADDRKEALFDNRFAGSSDNGVVSSLSIPALPGRMSRTSARPQKTSFAPMVGR